MCSVVESKQVWYKRNNFHQRRSSGDMSLFPSFNDAALSADIAHEFWLENSSFQIKLFKETGTLVSFNSCTNDKKNEEISKIHKKRYRKVNKRDSQSFQNDFFIDKRSTKEFLTVKTISKPSVAKYKIYYYVFNGTSKKNVSCQRYFNQVLNSTSLEKKKNMKISGARLDSLLGSSDFYLCKEQEELIHTTAFYNRSLSDEPSNVGMWMKFINFQDTIFKWEKTFKKGSLAKALRTNAERKLNILEKALVHNTNSENLHRERLRIMVSVYPADELQKHLKQLLEKDSGNITLWQGYIEATQCSMSHCNTYSVLNLYISCLSTLHKLKRKTCFDNIMLEENILRMLYQCGLFLKQSGLFERLWTVLKMYLEINLDQLIHNSFHIPTNEEQVLELEDMVLKSQLPHHELWLRIEKLRELCHWLPVTEDCPDPQRIIFTNEVCELIQPITMPENMFRLIVIILTLLKIPLLPCRHNTMQELRLDHVPWALDSIETLLPMFYEIYPLNLHLESFLIDLQLVVGPQYLKVLPGQEEYLNFILNVMQRCIDYLQGKYKYSLIIWWLRFQRLLFVLHKASIIKIPVNIRKNIKLNVKNLLKKTENRNNSILYIEYALLEKEITSDDNCIQILQSALTFIKEECSERTQFQKEQGTKCYLIRTLVETMIHKKKFDEAQKYLVNFVLGNIVDSECELNDATMNQASLKFEQLTTQYLTLIKFEKLPPVEHFLPIFFCDWIICNGWFIYLTTGPLQCGTFLETILQKLNSRTQEILLHKEIIYEFYVAVMFKFSVNEQGFGLSKATEDVLCRALEYCPNNLFILSVMAKRQYMIKSLGPKWWRTKKLLLNSGHVLPVLVLISTTYQMLINCNESFVDVLTATQEDADCIRFKFKMLSLFKETIKSYMCTRRCGLVWRLYLQFAHKYLDTKLCKKIYYSAVEECPWLKVLYIDAASYIPAELEHVQDLLIEKQLRIHITPEELNILRD